MNRNSSTGVLYVRNYQADPEENYKVRTVFRILIQLYVSIKMKENESKSK
jgi:hypothetical protein